VDFRHSFAGHEAHSVECAGLKGKKNGELLEAAEVGGYRVLLTVDQGVPRYQTVVGGSSRSSATGMGTVGRDNDPTRSR
jgi:hypothetical protein